MLIGSSISLICIFLQLQGVQAYLDREVARRNFVVARWTFREEEKREIEAENKRKMGVRAQSYTGQQLVKGL